MLKRAAILLVFAATVYAQRGPSVPLGVLSVSGSLTVMTSRSIQTPAMASYVISIQTSDSATSAFRITLSYSLAGERRTVSSVRPRDWSFGTSGYTHETLWIPMGAKVSSVDISEEHPATHISLEDPEN